MTNTIEIKSLKKSFKSNLVLDGIDLSVKKGDVIGVIGPSGTGKSTLLRCINLLERPESGTINLNGKEVNLSTKNRAEILALRRATGMVFQRFNLFEGKTALENVMEGLIVVQKKSRQEAREIALKELENVGLADKINHYPKHLSGGQQQRVAIARTLAMRPELILLDEPTSALDPELVGEVLEVIKKIADEGFTMILVSHEMNFIRNVSNRVIFLDKGHIIEDGTPKEVFDSPKNERTREFFRRMAILEQPEYQI
ncbi:MAG: amino acid ABC transporter ATP-binding protein [Treponema sp.]|nr:amino acid ABC transporter ATP-binding protein [Treponema sp.]